MVVSLILGGQGNFLLAVPDGELILDAVVVDLIDLGYNIAVQVIRAARNVGSDGQASDLSILEAVGLLGQSGSLGNLGSSVPVVNGLAGLNGNIAVLLGYEYNSIIPIRKLLPPAAVKVVPL